MSECRVHSCVFQQRVVSNQLAVPNAVKNCRCREVVILTEAELQVKCGEANWIVVARNKETQEKPCDICGGGDTKASCHNCKGTGKVQKVVIQSALGRDIVLVPHEGKTKTVSTPRVPTIESKHILRAYVSNDSRALVAAIQNGAEQSDFDDDLVFIPLGYVGPEQRERAKERINEYGLLILEARSIPGPAECRHRKEFKCSRCEVPAGEKVNVIGVEPKDNKSKAE